MEGVLENELNLRCLLTAIKPNVSYLESAKTSLNYFFTHGTAQAPSRGPLAPYSKPLSRNLG